MNYQELVNAVKGYLENDFPNTVGVSSKEQIDGFIHGAEHRIYTSVQLPSLKANVVGTVEANVPYLTLPEDFLAFESVAIRQDGVYSYLLDKGESFIRESFPDKNDRGLPKYVAVFGPSTTGSQIPERVNTTSAILGPTPDKAYEIELHYFYLPSSITEMGDNSPGHTWLGDNFPTALLYGTILEAAVFMQMDKETMAVYQTRYDEAMTLLRTFASNRSHTGAYRGRGVV